MRGLKKRFLCMGMIFALAVGPLLGNMLVIPAAAENLSMSYYVSLTGNDSNTGSIDQPFRTVEKARDAIRALKSAGGLPEGGVTVYIRGGIYSLQSSLAFTGEDSGESGKPVVYSAYPGETVSFMGGYDLNPADFGKVTDPAALERLPDEAESNVLVLDLPAHGFTQYGLIPKNGYGWPKTAPAPELYISGKSMTLARYPNNDYVTISELISGGFAPRDQYDPPLNDPGNPGHVPESEWLNQPAPVFKYSDERLDKWAQEPEGWLFGYWRYSWADDNLKIAGIDPLTNTITTQYPSFYGCTAAGRKFFGYNLMCELDTPSEWYLDRADGRLYVYPAGDLTGSTIQLTALKDTMVTMNNVSNVTIQGITFERTCGKGISMMDCESCTIAGCTIRYTGMRAMEIGTGDEVNPESPDYFNLHGGHNNSVISCDIYSTGMGGIFMAGGDRQTLTPGNNKVENCNFWDFSRIVRTSTPAINMGGCGNIARHNLIHNAPHFAIQFMGNDMLIEYNEIYNVLQETGDSGVIYSGRDWSFRGNVIRYNYIHDIPTIGGIGTFAIYMDDCMSSAEVYGNIFYNLAGRTFMMGGGRDHKIYNNILINCGKGIAFDSRGLYDSYDNIPTQMKRLNNMPFKAEPWATRYPELAATGGDVNILKVPAGNVIENNAYINTPDAAMDQAVIDNSTIENNKHYSASDEVGFVDKVNRNFNLKSDSVIFTDIPGFQSIPYSDIVIYADSWRTAANTTGEFDLISPANGATNIDPTGFKPAWSVSDRAERYRLLVSKKPDFTDIVVDSYTNSNNADDISMILPENTTLYWKVEASLNSDLWRVNKCSSTRSFTTSKAPPVLFSDGFENGLDNWTPLSGFPSPSISTDQHHSGNNSLKISSDITVISHTFEKSLNGRVSIWFYDNASKQSSLGVVARADDGDKCISLGAVTDISAGYYMYRIDNVEKATSIARTTGWHELKWDYTSGTGVDLYIDGHKVASSAVLTAFSKIAMGDYWTQYRTSNLCFDDIEVRVLDTTAPAVADGTISSGNVKQTEAVLSWSKAADNTTTQCALQYLVYRSNSDNLDTVENIEANGTAIGEYASDIASKEVTGLTAGKTYCFNVVVKDEAGNKSCYTMTSVTTLAAPDTAAPTVADGTITGSNVTTTGVALGWSKATDNTTTQGALQYMVYRSDSNNIDTVDNIEHFGTAIGEYASDIAEKEITGLTAGTAYHFNIIVRDEAGNKSCYAMTSVTTLAAPDMTKPFIVSSSGKLDRTAGIKAVADVGLINGADTHTGREAVVFQLMKGSMPVSIIAVEKDIVSNETFTAYFNVADPQNSNYIVRVFVFDSFSNDVTAPVSLAEPAVLD
ncbi:MAG: right-handed parallel beta-helix repeat-containing protein [Clostridiaceae bacterium]